MKFLDSLRQYAYLCITIIYVTPLCASQYGPGLLFHKPYNPKPYVSNYFMTYSAGQTDSGYNKNGAVVPFLQEYGTEDFLRKFIDPNLPKNNIEKIGTVNLSGTFKFQQVNFSYLKNIHHNLFIGIATSIRNLSINAITTDIQLFNQNLTPAERLGIERFKAKVPKNINKAGMYTTAIEAGYNKILTDFESIDFLHLFIKGGIATPQSFTGNGLTLLQFPIGGNITFSYPVVTILTVGILDHVNIGLFGMFIGLQPTQITAPVNSTGSNNRVILTESTRVQVNPKPIFSLVGYMEFHNFVPHCMGTIGYGHAHGLQWSLSSFNEKDFPSSQINRTEILSPWSITSMFFTLDYSFASDTQPHAPNLSFSYTMPIAGSYYPKMSVGAGLYNLLFTYEF